jgi:hypothetical protein
MRIVIPAFRAADTLPRCVRAIVRTSPPDNREIVVVDDGGNGDIESLLAGLPVSLIHTGGTGSAAIARNTGALDYGGDVLVFIDADVEVAEDAIGQLVAPIASGAADATVGNYGTDISGMSFAQAYKQLYLSRIYSRRAGYIRNHFWTALGAMRASTFKALRGFAPRFKGACDEDTELGQRLTESGGRILAVPQARARKLKPYSLAGLVRNDLRKGMSTIRLFLGDNVALTDNRHASRRDILAVFFAGACAVLLTTSPWLPWPAGIALPAMTAAVYLVLRADLIRAFWAARLVLRVAGCAGDVRARPRARILCGYGATWTGTARRPDTFSAGVRRRKAVRMSMARLQSAARLFAPGAHMPVYLLVFVTARCDARCGHCFYWQELNSGNRELSLEEYDRLARSLGPVLQVTLTGGNPERARIWPILPGSSIGAAGRPT